jgi:epoxide hydrolase-like predicted phosphatase
MPSPVQAVIFDFFGVICAEITPFVLPRYMSEDVAVAYKADIVERADRGEIDLDDVLAHLSKLTGAAPADLLAEFWAQVKIDAGVVALMDALRGRYKVALLSNAMRPFLDQILEKYDLKRRFDVMVISCEEHVTKPDPKIYRLVVERLGVPAGACVFTDDNPVNVAAANAAGIAGVRFTGVDALKAELKTLGIV